jgi:hypothetical protein
MTSLRDLSKPTNVPPYKRRSRARDPNNPSKGGRPPGSLNKRTISAIEKAKAQLPVMQRLSLTGLRETARFLGSAMALKQPWNADGSERQGGDYRTFMELAVLQLRYLEAITPYEAPRLAAIAIAPAPPVDEKVSGEKARDVIESRLAQLAARHAQIGACEKLN